MLEHTTNPRPLDIVTPFISSSYTKTWLASRSSWSSSCWRAAVSPLSCFSLRSTSTIHKSISTIQKDDFTQERISDERDAVINRFLFTCWLKSTLSCSLPEEKKGKVKENNQKHMKEVCFACFCFCFRTQNDPSSYFLELLSLFQRPAKLLPIVPPDPAATEIVSKLNFKETEKI